MNTELMVSRGITRCLGAGLVQCLKNIKSILFFCLPLCLLLIGAGVLMDRFVTAKLILPDASLASVLPWGACSVVLFVFVFFLFQSALVCQQHQLGANDRLPGGHVFGVWRQVMRLFCRNLLVSGVCALFFAALVVAMIVGIKAFLNSFLVSELSAFSWIGVGAGALAALCLVLSLVAFMQLFWANYMYGNQRFFDTLRQTFANARHLGRTMALQFIKLLYGTVLLLVFCFPYALFVLMEKLAAETVAGGDAVELPSYYPYLYGVALFSVVAGIVFVSILSVYPSLYNWCSIQSREKTES